jgi:hypothetical protein
MAAQMFDARRLRPCCIVLLILVPVVARADTITITSGVIEQFDSPSCSIAACLVASGEGAVIPLINPFFNPFFGFVSDTGLTPFQGHGVAPFDVDGTAYEPLPRPLDVCDPYVNVDRNLVTTIADLPREQVTQPVLTLTVFQRAQLWFDPEGAGEQENGRTRMDGVS